MTSRSSQSGTALKAIDRALLKASRRLGWTGRARVALCLAPIVLPFAIAGSLGGALRDAVAAFVESMKARAQEGWHFWYRDVYRVARYGSVHDE